MRRHLCAAFGAGYKPLVHAAEQRNRAPPSHRRRTASHRSLASRSGLQSAHVERAGCGRIDWQAIALLYEGLVWAATTLGALVGRAAALAEASGPDAGFAMLDAITPESVQTYQPYWAVRAYLLRWLEAEPRRLMRSTAPSV